MKWGLSKGFYKKDWFVALVLGFVFLVLFYNETPFLEKLETLAYNTGVSMTHRNAGATDQIVLVTIDEPSLKELGRWPWPRNLHADMIDLLNAAKAKTIGLLIFFNEPQNDPGLQYVRKLKQAGMEDFARSPRGREIKQILEEAELALDVDSKLAASIGETKNLFIQMYFRAQAPLGKPDSELPEFVTRNRLPIVKTPADGNAQPRLTDAASYPLSLFGERAAGIGHANVFLDGSGGIRSEFLLVNYYGDYYPSFALRLATHSLNLSLSDIVVDLGSRVKVGNLNILTTPEMAMLSGFYPLERDAKTGAVRESAFAHYSFHDTLAGRVSPDVFKNKIVLIGPTAPGIATQYATPTNLATHSVELTANFVASILNQDFYTRPGSITLVEFFIFIVVAVYLMIALPRMNAKIAALISFVLLVLLLGSEQYLMVSEKMWLKTVTPSLLLIVGHLALTTMRYFLTERQKIAAETDSVYTNRMLGLAFQNQGQLDMAMDKFRKLPVDESVLELFYNLALDFERKRQFNKAVGTYDYVLKHDAKFRDAAERKKRAHQAEQTILIGGNRAGPGGTLVLDAGHKPTLGRYEVEKELGKGAMGVVYLGRDPKINRVVAIKTMALGQEFEGADLEQAKERFFREAETAGRLNHPNIVTIYDAGEDQELAYIAMELLQGKDLTHFLKTGHLPPLPWVLTLIADIAAALDYAHKNGVVHRDIKPANIIYLDDKKTVKVTDFGIARITASSRTKTGIVLGTPSYMSPEQVAGKHVDGRSDLFSLGVMLFELCTGKLPFVADTLATLMYNIANIEARNARTIKPDLPECVAAIIERLLNKNPDERYQTGTQVKDAIESCQRLIADGSEARAAGHGWPDRGLTEGTSE
jgi:serine/threonine-protein kinase